MIINQTAHAIRLETAPCAPFDGDALLAIIESMAERIAIDSHRDYTTRRMLDAILVVEEQYTEELSTVSRGSRCVTSSSESRPADRGLGHMATAMGTHCLSRHTQRAGVRTRRALPDRRS